MARTGAPIDVSCSHCQVDSISVSRFCGSDSRAVAWAALTQVWSACDDCSKMHCGKPKARRRCRAAVFPTPGVSVSRSHAASSSRSISDMRVAPRTRCRVARAGLLVWIDQAVPCANWCADIQNERIGHTVERSEHHGHAIAFTGELDLRALLSGGVPDAAPFGQQIEHMTHLHAVLNAPIDGN